MDDDHWLNPSDSEAGATDRLAALQRAQDALWLQLRNEEDPERRMVLLSQFSENRAAIEQLTESVAAGGDPTSVTEHLRVELIDLSEADDPTLDADEPAPAERTIGEVGEGEEPYRSVADLDLDLDLDFDLDLDQMAIELDGPPGPEIGPNGVEPHTNGSEPHGNGDTPPAGAGWSPPRSSAVTPLAFDETGELVGSVGDGGPDQLGVEPGGEPDEPLDVVDPLEPFDALDLRNGGDGRLDLTDPLASSAADLDLPALAAEPEPLAIDPDRRRDDRGLDAFGGRPGPDLDTLASFPPPDEGDPRRHRADPLPVEGQQAPPAGRDDRPLDPAESDRHREPTAGPGDDRGAPGLPSADPLPDGWTRVGDETLSDLDEDDRWRFGDEAGPGGPFDVGRDAEADGPSDGDRGAAHFPADAAFVDDALMAPGGRGHDPGPGPGGDVDRMPRPAPGPYRGREPGPDLGRAPSGPPPIAGRSRRPPGPDRRPGPRRSPEPERPARRRTPADTSQTPAIRARGRDGGSDRRSGGFRGVLTAAAALVVVIGLLWFVVNRPGDDEPNATSEPAAVAGTDEPAGPAADAGLQELNVLLVDQGYGSVVAEARGDVVFLIGSVSSADDRDVVAALARTMAGGRAIDTSELAVPSSGGAGEAMAEPTGRSASLQAEVSRVTAATPIIFDVGQTDLTDLHVRILNSVAAILSAYPDQVVTIVGFTDDTGPAENNRRVSLARAESVRSYLISQGVPEGSLVVDARGEEAASGSSALANLERRVEFEVQGSAGGTVADPSDAEQLRIAIVAPSARNDLAFTQSMVDAATVVASERGNVEVSVTDNTFVPEEAAAAIRAYADEGYDLVIAHGSQFGPAVLDLAPQFPDVAFAWGTASDTFGLPNVYAYDAAANQGGYVLGTMSTLLSETGVVGIVGPIEVGDAQLYVNGFEAGARAAKPDATVLVTYTGSFSDLALAAEAAEAHLAAGSDVMTGSAQMVVGAVSVASENGALWFGTQANQTSLAPDLVVASQVYHWEVILRSIVADIDAGAAGGRTYTADLANGGLVIEFNPGYALPPEVRQRADEAIAGIVNGSIVPPR